MAILMRIRRPSFKTGGPQPQRTSDAKIAWRGVIFTAGTALVCALLALGLRLWVLGTWFDPWEYKNYDDLLRHHATYKTCTDLSRVMIIAIDAQSEAEQGPFPWPRKIEG